MNMANDADKPEAADEAQLRRLIADSLIAAALAAAGFVYLLDTETKHEAWIGFGLVALGVVMVLMRGQRLKGFAAGPTGLKIDLEEMRSQVREAAEKAETAQAEAEAAKQIAAQQITEPIGKAARASSDAETKAAPAPERAGPRHADGDWAHPDLERGKAPPDDPQKGQWGGQDIRNGRQLSAEVKPVGDELFEVRLTVRPVGNAPPIEGDVRFHLHDTFPRQVRTVKAKDGAASLSVVAWGAFTVGAEVRGEPDTYLELDLADPRYGFPKKFALR